MMDTVSRGLSVEELKERVSDEPALNLLGIKIQGLSPGYARLSLEVKKEHLNFSGRLFGGITAALADEAFSLAVSSIVYPAVGTQLNVYYYSGAAEGDEVIAECRVSKSGKRLGFVEITITNSNGTIIARANGTYVPMAK